jgi:Domain of unknown function (DUF4328)
MLGVSSNARLGDQAALSEPAILQRCDVNSYTPGGLRLRATLVTLGLAMLADVGSLAAGVLQLFMLNRIRQGHDVSGNATLASDTIYGCLGVLQVLFLLTCAVAFSMWFHRAYRNLSALSAEDLRFTPAKAVGSFYIPFVNLVRPYHVAKEIWTKSDPQLSRPTEAPDADPRRIGLWWLCFLVSGMAGNIAGRLMMQGDAPSEQFTATAIMFLSDVLSASAAALAISMVRGISQRQDARHRALTLGQQSGLVA